jgi:hypothetical protein
MWTGIDKFVNSARYKLGSEGYERVNKKDKEMREREKNREDGGTSDVVPT